MSGNETLKETKQSPVVQRLFFALWPSTEVRQQLSKIAKSTIRHSDGRRTRDENLHITLRFLGSVHEDKLACIENVASEIKTKPFELMFDQLVFKKRQEMVWLTTDKSAQEELTILVNQLEQGIQTCGFTQEKYAYKPHIVLTRKTRKTKELPEIVPVKWPVDAFVLVSSKTLPEGVEYSVVKEWKL